MKEVIYLFTGVDGERWRYGRCQFHHGDGRVPAVPAVWLWRLQTPPWQDRLPRTSPSLHLLLQHHRTRLPGRIHRFLFYQRYNHCEADQGCWIYTDLKIRRENFLTTTKWKSHVFNKTGFHCTRTTATSHSNARVFFIYRRSQKLNKLSLIFVNSTYNWCLVQNAIIFEIWDIFWSQ